MLAKIVTHLLSVSGQLQSSVRVPTQMHLPGMSAQVATAFDPPPSRQIWVLPCWKAPIMEPFDAFPANVPARSAPRNTRATLFCPYSADAVYVVPRQIIPPPLP